MFSTENQTNVTEVPVAEATEHWEFTKAETVGINLGLAPQKYKKSLRLSGNQTLVQMILVVKEAALLGLTH